MRYALIDPAGIVANVITWDGKLYHPDDAPEGWTPPDGMEPVQLPDDSPVGPGDIIDTGGKITKQAPPAPPEPDGLSALVAVLQDRGVLTAQDAAGVLDPPTDPPTVLDAPPATAQDAAGPSQ